jgi:hypothetical protein
MSETLVAALIAAAATVSASLLQLKLALSKELAARNQGGSRRKQRFPFLLMLILLLASGAGGFAVAQWLHEGERVEQNELRRELEARITEIGRTATQLEMTRTGVRAEIEAGVLRRLGEIGSATFATVGPCRPSALARVPSSVASVSPSAACTEGEATPITLCTSLPAAAKVVAIELFARPGGSTGDWSASRAAAGREIERARFSDRSVETNVGDGSKHICHTFVHWNSDRPHDARMLVRYTMP